MRGDTTIKLLRQDFYCGPNRTPIRLLFSKAARGGCRVDHEFEIRTSAVNSGSPSSPPDGWLSALVVLRAYACKYLQVTDLVVVL